MAPPAKDLPTLLLPNLPAWSRWLAHNAATSPGTWLVMAKKGTAAPTTLTPAQALDEALCHGWINGQARAASSADVPPGTSVQRWTPRAKRSTWSRVNVAHVERLAEEGRMQARGWEEVERARADGRWDAAYGGVADIAVPGDLVEAIGRVEGAGERWQGLSKGERYRVCLGLVGVRTERGRERAIGRVVEGLVGGKGEGEGKRKGKKRKVDDLAEAEGDGDVDVQQSPPVKRESRAERAERRSKRLENGKT